MSLPNGASIAEIAPKLKKLLLMLSSEQPGEIVAAAAAIGRTLHTAGSDWHDLTDHLLAPASTRTDTQHKNNGRWRGMCAYCASHSDRLRPRERKFIDSLADSWRGELTTKQMTWLKSIYDRLRPRAAWEE